MKTKVFLLLSIVFSCHYFGYAQNNPREVAILQNDWLFTKGDVADAKALKTDESEWQKVSVPHDWAISGKFDKNNDAQDVKVLEDGETKLTKKVGRTGGLPFEGVGWYRKHLALSADDKGKSISLEFDGAMSHAKIYINGVFVGEWPYGYSSFQFDISKYLNFDSDNVLAVRLQNYWESSRWYPGAGIYRNVRLVKTNPVHVAHWGTFITTPTVNHTNAKVQIETTIENVNTSNDIKLLTTLYNQQNAVIGSTTSVVVAGKATTVQEINVTNPSLWTAETPNLYYAITKVLSGEKILDEYKTEFGIRKIEFTPQQGMLVNGIKTKLKGVCLHSDLGPLGMAINKSALRYRLQLLKEMGCNAIRGTHNPQAPEMVELCDEMGFYFIPEAFDEWKSPKLKNGYHLLFDDWAKKDLEAMIRRNRNHPSVIMYSIGNEVREQNDKDGYKVAQYLTDICHQTDATRPTTAGFNNWNGAIKNGLANVVDIPGWNYKPEYYAKIHKEHPNWVIYGSETASTVSSRGAYELPAIPLKMKTRPTNQSSAYDLEYCSWSQLPDMEWQSQDKNDFVAGEFVWTGFDYLGEPTPYGSIWPSRSSYFGIIDLAGMPKDRYYLYQSKWSNQKVLHVLPHWNWEGKEGQIVPVYAYTNYPSAELFINGKSYGKKSFDKTKLLDSYRLRWENAVYESGNIKVVTYDANGNEAEAKIIRTAGKPAKIILSQDKTTLQPNKNDMAFVTVSVVDKDGNLCPLADNLINFKLNGVGALRAVGNGNAASLEPFEAPYRKAFYGKCMAIIQSTTQAGTINITAESDGLVPSTIQIQSLNNSISNAKIQ
ncbi:beta-galactosidase GalB [Pedobacter arcticus]|uniref:beta-galactosidase GalB n=1 Tax=Pedobacter arcticus TaxID=752140 RepID=UPI0002FEFE40|nr:beta-galactosidase GalB [Pedobacter arcticus]